MPKRNPQAAKTGFSRREILGAAATGALVAAGGLTAWRVWPKSEAQAEVFIARAASYTADLKGIILSGLAELGFSAKEVSGRKVLLKPNLVEPHAEAGHINTHPLLVRAAAEAFFSLGAGSVLVAEGTGHRRDSFLVLEESGLGEVLLEDKIPFLDLNLAPAKALANLGEQSALSRLVFPLAVLESDIVVSLAKLKTHHWAGVTLSMKNLFGVMPGSYYGWPKNALHLAGIVQSVLDINATLRPQLAIVDGIVGMEGDGPIMGDPVDSKVLILGRNPTAVDATCARIMGLDPAKVEYLAKASGWLGPIREANIIQRGELVAALRHPFKLMPHIPAQANLSLDG